MNLITFASPLHDATSVYACRQNLFDRLKDKDFLEKYGLPQYGKLSICDCGSAVLPTEDVVCFIATGGTEELFREKLDQLPKDIILLSDGYHNSLAASFEIASFLDQHGISARMVNIPLETEAPAETTCDTTEDENRNRFGNIYNPQVREYLSRSTVGLIGGASSWLIASDVDLDYLSSEFGTRFIHIGIDELIGDSMGPLMQALMISLFLVYMVIVLIYERFDQPLLIMFTVPFCVIGVVLFVGLTAWDSQRIADINATYGQEMTNEELTKIGILGALSLYLDFLNIFLYLLRIFGRSDSN